MTMKPLEQFEQDLDLYQRAKELLDLRYVDDSAKIAHQIQDRKIRFVILSKIAASKKMTETLRDTLFISPEAMKELKEWGQEG